MNLGEILDRLDDERAAEDALMGLGDLVLIARIRGQAETAGLGVGPLLASIVGNFVGSADSQAWTQLVMAANNAQDPGAAALKVILAHG